MSVSWSHVFQQGPCIRTLGKVAVAGLLPKRVDEVQTPGPKMTTQVPPRKTGLLDAYADWCGGSENGYGSTVPPHLFPQWGFPPLADALGRLPWPMTKVLNQGCRLEVNMRCPPTTAPRCGVKVREEAHKVRLTTRIVGTTEQPECLVADVYAVVPLSKQRSLGKRKRTCGAGRPSLVVRAHVES